MITLLCVCVLGSERWGSLRMAISEKPYNTTKPSHRNCFFTARKKWKRQRWLKESYARSENRIIVNADDDKIVLFVFAENRYKCNFDVCSANAVFLLCALASLSN